MGIKYWIDPFLLLFFQGRFKSVVVEDLQRLGWLRHYINLNPVRAGICDVAGLRNYRWCGYRLLWDKRRRPAFLSFEASLDSAGSLADDSRGRSRYAEYLAWLCEDEPRRKTMLFDRMSKGWALGTSEFKRALLEDEKNFRACMELGVDSEAKSMRELAWEAALERCVKALSRERSVSGDGLKSAHWKVAIACRMKESLLCRNGWLAERLEMGTEYAVSRDVAELRRGERKEAERLLNVLATKEQGLLSKPTGIRTPSLSSSVALVSEAIPVGVPALVGQSISISGDEMPAKAGTPTSTDLGNSPCRIDPIFPYLTNGKGLTWEQSVRRECATPQIWARAGFQASPVGFSRAMP